MCDPVTALMAAGTLLSAKAQIDAGKAADQSAQYNAALMNQQAAYEDTQAKDAIERGAEDMQAIQREGAKVQGAAKAGFSASNVDISFGSPLDVLLSNARNIETDLNRTGRNAQREAEGISFGAEQTRSQAAITRAEGRNTRSAARIGGVATVLSGGAKIYKHRANIGSVA